MAGLISGLKEGARRTARAAALSVIGSVFLIVGLAFLSVALWMIVAVEYGQLVAFEVLGALYIVMGLVCLLLRPSGNSASEDRVESGSHGSTPPPMKDPFLQMAEGFAMGMQAGRAAREPRD